MELAPDFVLKERYQIIRSLGHGGMGAVYLAHDTVLDHVVAVKVNHSPAEEADQQFLKEARLLAALRHPTLPRVTDYFMDGDRSVPGDGLHPGGFTSMWSSRRMASNRSRW